MSSASPSATGLSDGPNKKSRLLELIQLPDSLDDAVLQSGTSTMQQHLPADEAQRQLGTLQLGSGDDPASPVMVVKASATGGPAGADTSMGTEVGLPGGIDPAPRAPEGAKAASKATHAGSPAAAGVEEPAGAAFQREASLEAAPSDPGVCVSYDVGAGSSALEGLGGDEGEGEVASRRPGSAALAGGPGADRGRGGGFEVFMGGLATDAREDEVREALAELGQGEVLSVRLQLTRGTSICKGYGFATFAEDAAAQRAIAAAAAGERLCGRRVGLHASRRPFRAVLAEAQAAGSQPPLHVSRDPEASINELLGVLRAHPDRRAAVAAALQVVQRGAKRAFTATAAPAAVATAPADSVAAKIANTGKRQATAAAVEAAAEQTVMVKVEVPASLGTNDAENAGPVSQGPATAVAHVADAVEPIDLPNGASVGGPKGAAAAGGPAAAAVTSPGQGAAAVREKEAESAKAAAAAAAEEKRAEDTKTPVAPTAAAGDKSSTAAGDKSSTAAGDKSSTAAGDKSSTTKSAVATEKPAGAATAATDKPAAAAGEKAAGAAGSAAGAGSTGGAGTSSGGMSQDLTVLLPAYPKISKLLDSLKGTTRVPKTPLMVLHEYATKMSYEVLYLETSDGPAGPYAVEARLSSSGPNSTTIATASGKARTKRDAKQVSAAACLEKLLDGPRGLSPQDLLPAPKPMVSTTARGGKAAAGSDRGPGSNSGPANRKLPPGRGGSGPAPASLPQQQHHPHHRDALNRAVLPPPPPPPAHGPLRSGDRVPYGGGAGGHPGPIGRPPFGGSGTSGGGNSFIQPGLQPAHSPAPGALGRAGTGGGGSGASNLFGPPVDARSAGAGRARTGPDTYGAAGYGSFGYGNSGGGNGGAGGSGSMVQLGLGGSGSSASGASSSGSKYGGLYGRESARDGGGLGLESYGGSTSYDMAAGQKRNYSTAMQAAYGLPASSQGLLPVQPPQQPLGGGPGSVLGGASGGQDPFAVQASGGNLQPLGQPGAAAGQVSAPLGFGQPLGTSSQPVFGAPPARPGTFTQPLFGAQGQQQQPQALPQPQPQPQPFAAAPTVSATGPPPLQQVFGGYGQGQMHPQQQQQPLQLGFSQQPAAPVVAASREPGGFGLYGGGQTVQLQPAQPQSLFTQPPQQQATQNSIYGMTPYSQPSVQQPQPQQQQQYGNSGTYGGVSQVPQGSSGLFGSASMQQSQPQLQPLQPPQQLQPIQPPYSYGAPGLNAFGGVRSTGGLWS